jgi:hypothetical protein
MKTIVNPGRCSLDTRLLAALVKRCGGQISLTQEELAYIDRLEVDADRLNGMVHITVHSKLNSEAA